MHFSAQFSAEDAVTEDEKSRVWTHGPETGTFYNSVFLTANPDRDDKGNMDFTSVYLENMAEYLKLEPRVAEGKALRVSIIA